MFKPTNPKFDMLIASLKEDRDKKHNIDNEISELPFIFSEVDDLEKEIEEMECDISSLIEQKEEKTKRLSELQSYGGCKNNISNSFRGKQAELCDNHARERREGQATYYAY